MRVRSLLVLTALISSVLGGIATYLVLTVPNDLQAGALLKDARTQIAAGKTAEAQAALSKIVQQYPRTDAAAAAVVALVALQEQQRQRLQSEIETLKKTQRAQADMLADLDKNVAGARTAADEASQAAAQAAKAAAETKARQQSITVKKAPAKRPAKKTPTRRRR